jgi:two-component sensor histidine kinase
VTLAMVIHELASNALQHGLEGGGTLHIRTARTKAGWAKIEVMDNGKGVAEIASPSQDSFAAETSGSVATATMTAQNARSGIGLQLVRGLVGRELHGTFAMRENVTGGMTATVELPIARRAPEWASQ